MLKIASLANVKSCVTVGPIHLCLTLYSLSGLPLRLSPLTEDTFRLQCLVVAVTAVSNAPKASWVVMYTMNNHT